MLHTKPQGYWPFDSGEDDFLRVFTIYGHGGHLGSCDPDPANKLSFPHPTEAPYEIGLQLDHRFWGRRSLKMVDGQTEHAYTYYYKLTNEPKGSGELKKQGRSRGYCPAH